MAPNLINWSGIEPGPQVLFKVLQMILMYNCKVQTVEKSEIQKCFHFSIKYWTRNTVKKNNTVNL